MWALCPRLVEPKACLHETCGWVKKKRIEKEEDNKITQVCQNLVLHKKKTSGFNSGANLEAVNGQRGYDLKLL